MKKLSVICFLLLTIISCNKEKHIVTRTLAEVPKLDLTEANRLAKLPLHCMDTEYPNRLGQTLGDSSYLKSPKALHPAFYGCFDWHSAVHGHWSLVSLLKQFPKLDDSENIRTRLLTNISKENIELEIAYFDDKHNSTFERTYGWAWLLKLAEELHTWNDDTARELETNLQPLTDLIVGKYIEFLPKLNYPIRVGEHPNTAFGLTFAHDYAIAVGHKELQSLIEKRAKEFYSNDRNCPLNYEPSGFDFLSPCMEEAAIMKRVLSTSEFKKWFKDFLPNAINPDFNLDTGKVSDRKDGKLVHLDGVNFSRAWSLNIITKNLPEYEHLRDIANLHINYSLPSIVDDNYEGGHWLGSFAIYALNSVNHD
ncbi:DUF2891 domain-containing protein [Ichthyenterobacterium sp. W332]|uniref:DUF2891 domain-containing protein n=1 Tax=Microcosmobacter mediterraneus TaxID=3075607 RepID=A0ABU2YLR4_9FLAO|nr:DUF2891 domain-containing protein [Ichthyenterobacterium sp. W332]MDT0558765.1 DUF2891 domain-containing protein [Ichthyenterobacterium sp. W332]